MAGELRASQSQWSEPSFRCRSYGAATVSRRRKFTDRIWLVASILYGATVIEDSFPNRWCTNVRCSRSTRIVIEGATEKYEIVCNHGLCPGSRSLCTHSFQFHSISIFILIFLESTVWPWTFQFNSETNKQHKKKNFTCNNDTISLL